MSLTVMPSNNTGRVVRELHARFPGRLAHLISPGGWRKPFMPYALDNGAFRSYKLGHEFDEDAFYDLIERARFEDRHEGCPPYGSRCPMLWQTHQLHLNRGASGRRN